MEANFRENKVKKKRKGVFRSRGEFNIKRGGTCKRKLGGFRQMLGGGRALTTEERTNAVSLPRCDEIIQRLEARRPREGSGH